MSDADNKQRDVSAPICCKLPLLQASCSKTVYPRNRTYPLDHAEVKLFAATIETTVYVCTVCATRLVKTKTLTDLTGNAVTRFFATVSNRNGET